MIEGDPVTRAAFEEVTWSTEKRFALSRSNPDGGRTPAVSPALASVQHRTTWEPPRDRAVRAAWTRGGGRCYSLASASADSFLAHPLSSGRNVFRLEAEHVCLLGGVSRRPGC